MEMSKSTTQEVGRRRRKFHSGDLNDLKANSSADITAMNKTWGGNISTN